MANKSKEVSALRKWASEKHVTITGLHYDPEELAWFARTLHENDWVWAKLPASAPDVDELAREEFSSSFS